MEEFAFARAGIENAHDLVRVAAGFPAVVRNEGLQDVPDVGGESGVVPFLDFISLRPAAGVYAGCNFNGHLGSLLTKGRRT